MPSVLTPYAVPSSIDREYHQLFDSDTIYFDRVDGEVRRLYDEDHEWFLLTLIRIEQFVAEVLASDEAAFVLVPNAAGNPILQEGALARHFRDVHKLSTVHTRSYELSETIQLFFECWRDLHLGPEAFAGKRGYSTVPGKEPFERYNDLLALIRERGRSSAFRRRLSRRKERSADNQKRGSEYLGKLFLQTYSKLLVLRVDFAYLSEFSPMITPDRAREDIGRLFKRAKQHKDLGKHLLGQLWKLEWTPKKGCHFHAIVIYDGHYRMADIHLAKMLGEFWKLHITDGRGVYWNCNRYKENYAYLGIGQIHRNDMVKRGYLVEYVLGYLTKGDQYLLADSLRQGRCFQPGHLTRGASARQ